MERRPICIIVSMEDVEADLLLTKMENVKKQTINKYNFYEGTINGYPTVICECLVNSINASVATYITIEKYNPICIINQGTSGGHGKDVHQNDIVIGEKCINIISTKTPDTNEGEGSNSLNWELVSFFHGEDDRLDPKICDSRLVELAKQVNYIEGKVYSGIIGSGDIWNHEADKILFLNKKYGTLCEEMEGYAICTVADNFNIPVIDIRVISNNELLGEKYDRKTAINSQKFVYDLILKIIE